MKSAQKLAAWSAVFLLTDGKVVCRGCEQSQMLADDPIPFPHLPDCKHRQERFEHPWASLHNILDTARG